MKIPALILIGPPGKTEFERWLAEGKLAAARDLIGRLHSASGVGPIFVYAGSRDYSSALAASDVIFQDSKAPFHFGEQFKHSIRTIGSDRIVYFGGASAPLLPAEWIERIIDHVSGSSRKTMVVNNYHSTDWAVFNSAELLASIEAYLPNDNAMGWVARNQHGFSVETLEPCAAASVDIDTPLDLLMLAGHPFLGSHMSEFLKEDPYSIQKRLSAIRTLMRTPASSLALVGRVSSHASRILEKSTQIWTRVYSEERGMTASGRLQRGGIHAFLTV